jgi:hypothetical protein
MGPYIQLPPSNEPPRKSLLTPARTGIAILITILLALFTLSSCTPNPLRSNSRLAMTSPAGWHSRATSHPDGSAYDVKKENVVFGLTRNGPVEHDGE